MIDYEKIMYSILKKYNLYNKREEYIDVCYIGYAKALKNFDETKATMVTYIYKCIENELLQELRKEKRLKRQREELSIDCDDYGHSLIDYISDDTDLENDIIEEEKKKELKDAIKLLSKNERIIIMNLYGICCEEITQEKLAKKLNISQTQIGTIKNKAIEKLKEILK